MSLRERILCIAGIVLSTGFAPAVARADTGPWYLGASTGYASYSGTLVAGGQRNPAVPNSGSGSAYSLGYDLFTGYRISSHWALEARWFDMGSADNDVTGPGALPCTGTGCAARLGVVSSRTTGETYGFMVSALGGVSFTDTWGAFLTGGVSEAKTTVKATRQLGGVITEDASNHALVYGAGVQLTTGGSWIFRFGWQQLHDVGDPNTTGTADVNFFFLSALCSL